MKKSLLLAFGCAMLAGTAVAQNAQEVTYVEDPAQGYLFNKFSDNWFIQGEGGVSAASQMTTATVPSATVSLPQHRCMSASGSPRCWVSAAALTSFP